MRGIQSGRLAENDTPRPNLLVLLLVLVLLASRERKAGSAGKNFDPETEIQFFSDLRNFEPGQPKIHFFGFELQQNFACSTPRDLFFYRERSRF